LARVMLSRFSGSGRSARLTWTPFLADVSRPQGSPRLLDPQLSSGTHYESPAPRSAAPSSVASARKTEPARAKRQAKAAVAMKDDCGYQAVLNMLDLAIERSRAQPAPHAVLRRRGLPVKLPSSSATVQIFRRRRFMGSRWDPSCRGKKEGYRGVTPCVRANLPTGLGPLPAQGGA